MSDPEFRRAPFDPPDRAFRHAIEVNDRDADVQGHASNVAVLSWLIDAAVAHSAALGWDDAAYRRLGATFVVRRHEIDYLTPAYPGDRVTVRTWPCNLEKATAERRYVAVKDDGSQVVRAVTVWAFVSTITGRPTRIPPEVRECFDW